MRAVNLIPADARRGTGLGAIPQGPSYILIGALAVALILVTIYVLTGNTISDRKAQLANLQQQVAQEQAAASRLTNYAQFLQLAQTRAQTVKQIASTRFDWHAALSDLSKVVPANTSLQSLLGTVAPGANVSGAGGNTASSAAGAGSTSGLRSAISSPAFEIRGCTASQEDVARLLSRLRLMNGVSRVTLADSQKSNQASVGAATTGTKTPNTGAAGCGTGKPSFDLVIFFQPLPGAGATGPVAAGTAGTAAAGAPGASAPSSPPASTSTTAGASK